MELALYVYSMRVDIAQDHHWQSFATALDNYRQGILVFEELADAQEEE